MDDILSHRSDSPHLYQPYVTTIALISNENELSLGYRQMKKRYVQEYM